MLFSPIINKKVFFLFRTGVECQGEKVVCRANLLQNMEQEFHGRRCWEC